MSHDHGHHHHGEGISHGKAFAIGIALNIIFVGVEIIYGLIANSSALLADAGHNASDVMSLIFAWTAAWLATLKPRGKYSYGFRKSTILASLWNAVLLFVAVGFIAWDAIGKLEHPEPVAGKQVMIVAGIGILINTITALLFIKGQKEDINIKGAFLHMAADAAVSLGVVVAGLLITLTGHQWIDPVMSFIIIAVILWGTWKLFIDSVNLSLDAVPGGIDIEKVRKRLSEIEGVEDVHDLHIWAISTTTSALSAHLVIPENQTDEMIGKIQDILKKEFNIAHTTIQIEKSKESDLDCSKC